MPFAISPTDQDVFALLRAFLVAILPAGIEVFQAQDNRVPEPKVGDFVEMTILRFPRLATNFDGYDSVNATKSVEQDSECVIQLDIHGSDSANSAQKVSALFRDEYAVNFFEAVNADIVPLHADDPRQMPFNNAEQQYENRYIVEAHLQVNQTIVVVQDFADTFDLTVTEIDTIPDLP